MAVTNAITDLIKSFYELLVSILGTAYSVVQKTVQSVFSFISGLFTLMGDIASGIVDVTGGVGKFVAGTATLHSIHPSHMTLADRVNRKYWSDYRGGAGRLHLRGVYDSGTATGCWEEVDNQEDGVGLRLTLLNFY